MTREEWSQLRKDRPELFGHGTSAWDWDFLPKDTISTLEKFNEADVVGVLSALLLTGDAVYPSTPDIGDVKSYPQNDAQEME